MSLVDPDARNRRVSSFLQPFAWVLAILALASAPVMVSIFIATGIVDSDFVFLFLIYILAAVGFGIFLYYVAAHRNGLGVTAYCFAYVGGMILIFGGRPFKDTVIPQGIIPAGIFYILHATAAHATLQNGVTTTATVTSAGINGLVNYVQHWRLTLKFTDQQGKERWFHIGRTGLGYEVGQEFQIKYNPNRPGSARGIVVLDG
jgi:hypothetical protein